MKKIIFTLIIFSCFLFGCSKQNTNNLCSDNTLSDINSTENNYNNSDYISTNPNNKLEKNIQVLDINGNPLTNAFIKLQNEYPERLNSNGIISYEISPEDNNIPVTITLLYPNGKKESENLKLSYSANTNLYTINSSLNNNEKDYQNINPRIECSVFYKDKTPVKNAFVELFETGKSKPHIETIPDNFNADEIETDLELKRGFTNSEGKIFLPLNYNNECTINVHLGNRFSEKYEFSKTIIYVDGIASINITLDI